jgi:hypothetical protein
MQSGVARPQSSGTKTYALNQATSTIGRVGHAEYNFTPNEGQKDDLDLLWEQLGPQEWLTPSAIPWNQWDSLMTNSAVYSN